MEKLSICWEKLADFLHDRPVQFISYLIATIIVAIALGFALISSTTNSSDIDDIKATLCSSPSDSEKINTKQCQLLLDKLLQDPTDEQVQRIQQIVREGR